MDMEELERWEKVESYKDDMIRQIASSTGQSAQMLRAMHRGQYVLDASTQVYASSEHIDQMAEPHVYGREDEDRRMYADRIGMMQGQLNQ